MSSRILVVDDSPDTEKLFAIRLKDDIDKGFFHLTFVNTSKEALEIVKKYNFDLVISNMVLSDIDGLSLIQMLSAPPFQLKSIIMTGFGDVEHLRKAMNSGAYDFCLKPIDFKELTQTIRRCLKYVATLRSYENTKKNLTDLQKELAFSAQLQQSILPKDFPDNEYVKIFGSMNPALEIGGDFYDFFWVEDHLLGLVIADVSGKNISAALYMALTYSILSTIATYGKIKSPAICLDLTNKGLVRGNESLMFTTAIYGILDLTNGIFTMSNAGHCPIVKVTKNGQVKLLKDLIGISLGVNNDSEYKDYQVPLEDGDMILLYTDGVIEAFNRQNQIFDYTNLEKSLKNETDPKKMIENLIIDVQDFSDGAPRSDDLTCLAFKFKKKMAIVDYQVSDKPETENDHSAESQTASHQLDQNLANNANHESNNNLTKEMSKAETVDYPVSVKTVTMDNPSAESPTVSRQLDQNLTNNANHESNNNLTKGMSTTETREIKAPETETNLNTPIPDISTADIPDPLPQGNSETINNNMHQDNLYKIHDNRQQVNSKSVNEAIPKDELNIINNNIAPPNPDQKSTTGIDSPAPATNFKSQNVKTEFDEFFNEIDYLTTTVFTKKDKQNPENTTKDNIFYVEMKNSLKEIPRISILHEQFAKTQNLPFAVAYNVSLILDEILTNTISYGYLDDKQHLIKIKITIEYTQVVISIIDDAMPFNPLEVKDPDINASIDERNIGGLGIYLAKKMSDHITYEYKNGNNLLTIFLKIPGRL